MYLSVMNLGGRVTWNLHANSSPIFRLSESSALVNPLLYKQLPMVRHEDRHPIETKPSQYLWSNSELVLADVSEEVHFEGWLERTIPLVSDFLIRLRYITGQSTLPNADFFNSATSHRDFGELPALDLGLWSSPPSRFTIRKFILDTAITQEHIKAALALPPGFKPPTHEVLLLDAISACWEKDYRRAILYVAVAMEVAFGSVIDDSYEQMLNRDKDHSFRVIEIQQGGGVSIRKDPIYERLRSKTDFSVLLHELSLYVCGRSLLNENQALYARAKRLYSTRNQLVHSGELSEADSSPPYPLDRQGATLALKVGLDLFEWLGIRHDFPLPDGGFVSGSTANTL